MNLFNSAKGIKIFLVSILIVLTGLSIQFVLKKKEPEMSSVTSSPDLINHPIYSLYNIKQDESVINIGIQPLYLPTGIIFEVIKRDNILNEAISASGKQIQYYSFLKGADVNFFLQQKMLDGGVGGDMPALSAAMSLDIVIPVIIQKGNASIVSMKPILTYDLKGKRIAYPHGSISHYFILELMQSAGITENMVKLIPMEVSSMAQALYNRDIDLFSAWEPTASSAIKQYPDFFISYKKITTGYIYFSKAFVQKNPEPANHLLAAVIRSISWMKKDRENLLMASRWNLIEMEKITGEKNILNAEEIADLALEDILGYYSKFSIIHSTGNFGRDSSLYNEFIFLSSFYKEKAYSNWDKVVRSFDNDLIYDIFEHSEDYQLNEYDYVITGK